MDGYFFFCLGAGVHQLRSKTDGLSGPLIALGVLRNGSPELALDAWLLNRHTPLVCTHPSLIIIAHHQSITHETSLGIILTGLSFWAWRSWADPQKNNTSPPEDLIPDRPIGRHLKTRRLSTLRYPWTRYIRLSRFVSARGGEWGFGQTVVFGTTF
jgi:hypothetical protein